MGLHGREICDARTHFMRLPCRARLTSVKYSERDSQDAPSVHTAEKIRAYCAVLKPFLILKN
jgi:hypothetical protein